MPCQPARNHWEGRDLPSIGRHAIPYSVPDMDMDLNTDLDMDLDMDLVVDLVVDRTSLESPSSYTNRWNLITSSQLAAHPRHHHRRQHHRRRRCRCLRRLPVQYTYTYTYTYPTALQPRLDKASLSFFLFPSLSLFHLSCHERDNYSAVLPKHPPPGTGPPTSIQPQSPNQNKPGRLAVIRFRLASSLLVVLVCFCKRHHYINISTKTSTTTTTTTVTTTAAAASSPLPTS